MTDAMQHALTAKRPSVPDTDRSILYLSVEDLGHAVLARYIDKNGGLRPRCRGLKTKGRKSACLGAMRYLAQPMLFECDVCGRLVTIIETKGTEL